MDAPDPAGSSSPLAIALAKLNSRVQTLLDKSSPLIGPRWATLILVLVIYILRVWLLGGFYIVSYGLGIFNLNLLLGFLTPQFDVDSEGPMLPTKGQEEFKPFVRRLPEFKFWYSSIRSILVGLFLTFFRFFDVPVFWPILLLYWFILFTVTMKRQIQHMIKYKYLPFSYGKKKYSGGQSKGGSKDNK